MGVKKSDDGKWEAWDNGRLVGIFDTNREAWGALDKTSGEPVSRAENQAEWKSRRNDF